MKTPDNWIKRHPDLIRLTGKHPFNVEANLPQMYDYGFIGRVGTRSRGVRLVYADCTGRRRLHRVLVVTPPLLGGVRLVTWTVPAVVVDCTVFWLSLPGGVRSVLRGPYWVSSVVEPCFDCEITWR